MKITDEMIKELAADTLLSEGHFSTFAYALIELAQEVGELEFYRLGSRLVCKTPIGKYSILKLQYRHGYWAAFDEFNVTDEVFDTEEEAIAAANASYKRRVLQCLVHGGV